MPPGHSAIAGAAAGDRLCFLIYRRNLGKLPDTCVNVADNHETDATMLKGGAPMARRTTDPESNFEVAVLGYNRQQVDQHIHALEQRMADAAVAFDAAITLQNQLNEARTEIHQLRESRRVPGADLSDRITTILAAAEEQAAAIRADAEQDARALRADAAAGPAETVILHTEVPHRENGAAAVPA